MTIQDIDRPTFGPNGVASAPRLLRLALLADAAASGVMGLILSAAAPALGQLLDLPKDLLLEAGVALIPWSAFVLWTSTRAPIPGGAARAIVAVNLVWVAGSLLTLALLSPGARGLAFVLVQAMAVAGLAAMQWIALRRMAAAGA